MKKPITILAALCLCASLAKAQTPAPAPADNTAIKTAFLSFAQNVESNRSLTVALYPMYAPDIVVNGKPDTFGFGLAALVPATVIPSLSQSPVAQHAFGGIRFDYLAHQAFASTVSLGLRGDFQIKGHDFETFVHSGANIPFSGFGLHNGDIGAMIGGGAYTSLLTWGGGNGSLGLQITGEKWTQFPGPVLLGGPVLNWHF
jgi:hypothetical protein